MAYNLDLRQRVVDAVRKAEQTKEESAERFHALVVEAWLKEVPLPV